jgi:outer membrane protein TolC
LSLVLGMTGVARSETFDLKACVDAALSISPQVRAADTDLEIAEALADQAEAVRYLPKLDLTWILGPSPEARGDAVTGDTNLSNLSVFNRTELTFLQPLYTFGRLDAARDAAAAGLDARTAGAAGSREKLTAQVAEAYHGLLLAQHLSDLADEARTEILKARDRIDRMLEEDEGDYTYTDLFKLDRFVFDVEENANKVIKGRALIASALRRLMGLSVADSIHLADDSLQPTDAAIGPLSSYLDRTPRRNDLQQLAAGVRILQARAKAARAEFYPQLFLAGQFKYSYAPNRDNQSSPFARDDFNFLQAGAVIGLRQSLAFGQTAAKARKSKLEYVKLTYQSELASMGASLEIERAYRDLMEAQANLAAARKARRSTRRWFISARDGFNGGLEEAGELIEAVKEYGIIRGKYFEAVYKFNKAWIALNLATGAPILSSQ